uniref:Uncharacterized protein MANES_03G159800 n=1 Tax=Rhizophora mucronata TaxID=61149 RepID=A0A2P2JGM5_RHIMU
MKTPSFLRHGLRCLTMTAGMTFFLSSGFPFFTVAITISPTQADGKRFRRPLIPFTEMMYRFLAPVLSAQFTVAATGRPSDILNLLPADPPRPKLTQNNNINVSGHSISTFRQSQAKQILLLGLKTAEPPSYQPYLDEPKQARPFAMETNRYPQIDKFIIKDR